MKLFEITKELNWANAENAEKPFWFSNDKVVLLLCNIKDVMSHGKDDFTLDLNSPHGGENAIGDRVKTAIDHFNSGEPMDPPVVAYVISRGEIEVGDGRHRIVAAYQLGHEYIPMFVSLGGLKEFKKLVKTRSYRSMGSRR